MILVQAGGLVDLFELVPGTPEPPEPTTLALTGSYVTTLTLTGGIMAVTTPDQEMYVGEDKTLNVTIYEEDGETPQDIDGWTIEAVLHKYRHPETVYVTKTTDDGITITSGNDGELSIDFDGEDTEDLSPRRYQLLIRRTDDNANTVLTLIKFTLLRT
jgi:hypothetical protein